MHNIWSFICDYNNRILPNIRKNNRLVLLKIFEKWEIEEKKKLGIGVFTVDGKMIDIAFYDGAKRTIELAKASGVLKEEF